MQQTQLHYLLSNLETRMIFRRLMCHMHEPSENQATKLLSLPINFGIHAFNVSENQSETLHNDEQRV